MSVSHAPRHCEGRSQGINVTPEAGGVANPAGSVVGASIHGRGRPTSPPSKKVPRIGGGRRSQAPPTPPGGRGGLPLLLVASSRTTGRVVVCGHARVWGVYHGRWPAVASGVKLAVASKCDYRVRPLLVEQWSRCQTTYWCNGGLTFSYSTLLTLWTDSRLRTEVLFVLCESCFL